MLNPTSIPDQMCAYKVLDTPSLLELAFECLEILGRVKANPNLNGIKAFPSILSLPCIMLQCSPSVRAILNFISVCNKSNMFCLRH